MLTALKLGFNFCKCLLHGLDRYATGLDGRKLGIQVFRRYVAFGVISRIGVRIDRMIYEYQPCMGLLCLGHPIGNLSCGRGIGYILYAYVVGAKTFLSLKPASTLRAAP